MKASEIKFKAWDNKEKKFIKYVEIDRIPTQNTRHGFRLKTNFELFQFTGEKDHAGKEIYDGDILEVSLHPHLQRTVVKFHDGGFVVEDEWNDESDTSALGWALGHWNGMDATTSVVGHIKTDKV